MVVYKNIASYTVQLSPTGHVTGLLYFMIKHSLDLYWGDN